MNHSQFPSACLLLLSTCLVFPPVVRAQEISPELLQMALDAYRQQQEERQDPEILPAIKLDPELVGMVAVVRLRDGRVYRGRILEVTQERLRLQEGDEVRGLPLADILFVVPQPVSELADWNNLATLRPGDRIEVWVRNEGTTSGSFLDFSDTGITLRKRDKEVVVRRDAVLRVWHDGGRDRSKAAGIGFLVGAAAGAATAGIAIAKHGDFQAFSFVTVMAASFGGIGAGFGALLAPKERTLVYQVP